MLWGFPKYFYSHQHFINVIILSYKTVIDSCWVFSHVSIVFTRRERLLEIRTVFNFKQMFASNWGTLQSLRTFQTFTQWNRTYTCILNQIYNRLAIKEVGLYWCTISAWLYPRSKLDGDPGTNLLRYSKGGKVWLAPTLRYYFDYDY